MLATLFWLSVICCVGGVVLFVIGYSRATPEQRKECDAQFRKAGEQMNDSLQKWNEERRQARAYKRARNAIFWKAAGKFFDKL
jgi:hypothetical protein